jgi:hypothetical protein
MFAAIKRRAAAEETSMAQLIRTACRLFLAREVSYTSLPKKSNSPRRHVAADANTPPVKKICPEVSYTSNPT